MTTPDKKPIALVTGGSAGLGRELTLELAARGWTVVTDARRGDRLADLADPNIHTLAGDVTDPDHRVALHTELAQHGGLDLLVHNASSLGPTPLPPLRTVTADQLAQVWRSNVEAPLMLTGSLLDLLLARAGVLLSITSDAAVEHYPGWGVYAASKAALEHITLTYAAENAGITAYAVDPGDMRTEMHQAAFPGEDISDRPLPEAVVDSVLALVDRRPPSGRYRAVDLAEELRGDPAGHPTGGAR